MLSPPSSPRPQHRGEDPTVTSDLDRDEGNTIQRFVRREKRKRAFGRQTRCIVLLVPFVLVLITASTRFLTHPIMFDVFSNSPPSWQAWTKTISDLRPHKRHPAPPSDTTSSAATQSSTSPSISQSSTSLVQFPSESPSTTKPATATTSSVNQQLPTIPSGPPALPTPFPEPFDTSLQNNFSSVSCYNFFVNMTNTAPFRSCRPFSMLLQSSQAFIKQAQTNVTLLNAVIWGTCNTVTSLDQCLANMVWFASALQTSCTSDLNDHNAMATNTLIGLQAFPLMHNTGCLADPTTNSYCYVEAAVNTNPSDLYFYQLPLGVNLPNSTMSTCSGCTKSLLGLYAAALKNSAEALNLSGLKSTYGYAASVASTECGQGFADTSITNTATGLFPWSWTDKMCAIAIIALAWSLVA